MSVSRIMGISISFLKLFNRLGTRYTLEISPTKNEGLENNVDSKHESLEMAYWISRVSRVHKFQECINWPYLEDHPI